MEGQSGLSELFVISWVSAVEECSLSGVVEGVVYIGREDTPSWETIHHTTPEEGATATHLYVCVCVVCVVNTCPPSPLPKAHTHTLSLSSHTYQTFPIHTLATSPSYTSTHSLPPSLPLPSRHTHINKPDSLTKVFHQGLQHNRLEL